MEISKRKVKFTKERKTDQKVIDALNLALKNKNWLPIAKIIGASRRKYSKINISDIESKTATGDTVIVVGKVLGEGEITKKVRVCAFSFSKSALDKLKKSKSEVVSILEEIRQNPKAQGLKLIR